MTYKLITNLVAQIIKAIEQSAIVQTKVLKKSVLVTQVQNLPKVQEIQGSVVVDQSGVEKRLDNVEKAVRGNKPVKAVSITNFPKIPQPPDFPKELKITNLKDIKSVSVDNHPIEKLDMIGVKLDKLTGEIKKIDVKPEVNVSPTPVVFPDIPKPIKPKDPYTPEEMAGALVSDDPEKYVPVRLTNGKKFYKAVDKIEKAVTGIVGGSSSSFMTGNGSPGKALVDDQGHQSVRVIEMPEISVSAVVDTSNIYTSPLRRYEIADVDDSSNPKYYGFTKADGGWYILKEDTSNGTYRYSKGDSSYNFSNRASESYHYFHEVF